MRKMGFVGSVWRSMNKFKVKHKNKQHLGMTSQEIMKQVKKA